MRRLNEVLARHWAIALVLVLAATVRVVAAIAYRPAIFFGDSWAYLDLAYRGDPVGFAPDRPSGYPLLIDLLSVAGRSLAAITTAQHLAGLAVGVLVYLLSTRIGLPRIVGAGAAALVLFDSYAIALEQQILAEAFFTLALVASLYLVVGQGSWHRGAGRERRAARGRCDDPHGRAVRRAGLGGVRPLAAQARPPGGGRRDRPRPSARRLHGPACSGDGAGRPDPGRRVVSLRSRRAHRGLPGSGHPGRRADRSAIAPRATGAREPRSTSGTRTAPRGGTSAR